MLLVAGGCCHDYAAQTKILKNGIESRLRAHVEVTYTPDTSAKAGFDVYSMATGTRATT